jgi:hypothetical protein
MPRGITDDEHGLPSFARHLTITRAAIGYLTRRQSGRGIEGADDRELLHALEVAWLLYGAGAPDDVVAAGVLHDVVERCNVSTDELRRHFGSRVAQLVDALTEDPSIRFWDERKAALHRQLGGADQAAGQIFAADKVSRVRQLHRRVERSQRTGRDAPRELEFNRDDYVESLRLLKSQMPDYPLVGRLEQELESVLAIESTPRGDLGAPGRQRGRLSGSSRRRPRASGSLPERSIAG